MGCYLDNLCFEGEEHLKGRRGCCRKCILRRAEASSMCRFAHSRLSLEIVPWTSVTASEAKNCIFVTYSCGWCLNCSIAFEKLCNAQTEEEEEPLWDALWRKMIVVIFFSFVMKERHQSHKYKHTTLTILWPYSTRYNGINSTKKDQFVLKTPMTTL